MTFGLAQMQEVALMGLGLGLATGLAILPIGAAIAAVMVFANRLIKAQSR